MNLSLYYPFLNHMAHTLDLKMFAFGIFFFFWWGECSLTHLNSGLSHSCLGQFYDVSTLSAKQSYICMTEKWEAWCKYIVPEHTVHLTIFSGATRSNWHKCLKIPKNLTLVPSDKYTIWNNSSTTHFTTFKSNAI